MPRVPRYRSSHELGTRRNETAPEHLYFNWEFYPQPRHLESCPELIAARTGVYWRRIASYGLGMPRRGLPGSLVATAIYERSGTII